MINKSKFQKLKKIDAKNIFLRKFTFGDINKSYLSWMNDFEITKYTESRDKKYNLQDLKNYYSEYGDNSLSPWFCICTKNDSKHIGNIKLDVREKWLRGNLELFLGDLDDLVDFLDVFLIVFLIVFFKGVSEETELLNRIDFSFLKNLEIIYLNK